MRSLFVMDPLDRIQVAGDSTYALMLAATERGLGVAMCTIDELYGVDGVGRATCRDVVTRSSAPFFEPGPDYDAALGDFDVVWMRKDPPFDMGYIFATYLLDTAPATTRVVNGPAGLKLFNEKMWVVQRWPEFQPPTLVSNEPDRVRDFVRGREGRTVLKPWDGNGGRGVLVTSGGDGNLNAMIDLLTVEGSAYVIAQGYLEGVARGDKRVLLFDGEPVGAMLRIPTAGDHRANMHVGATVQAAELSDRDREICEALREELVRWDMMFTGIDIIDGHLTEINVTSPTGIRELNTLNGTKLEHDLLDRVVARWQEERA